MGNWTTLKFLAWLNLEVGCEWNTKLQRWTFPIQIIIFAHWFGLKQSLEGYALGNLGVLGVWIQDNVVRIGGDDY